MLVLWAVALGAEVPPLNAQVLPLSLDGRAGFALDDGVIAPDRQLSGRLLLQYVNRPLVATYEDGREVAGLSDVLALDVLPSLTLGRVRVGLDVPIFLGTWGDELAGAAQFGDLAVDARYALLDPDRSPLGLAPSIRVALPTAGTVAPLGSGGFDGSFGVAASRSQGPWLFAANLGVHVLPEVQLENATWGSQVALRGGASRALGDTFGASAEVAAQVGLADSGGDPAASPVEVLVGGWARLPSDLVVRLGAGRGLSRGIGAPAARVLLGVAYEPSIVRDRDRDGVLDAVDTCPAAPEDKDDFADLDGCPDPDNDADGVADAADGCPAVAEDRDGWEDDDGCADPLTVVTVRLLGEQGQPLDGGTARVGEFINHGAEGTTGLSPGTYTLVGEAPGHHSGAIGFDVSDGPPREVVLRLTAVPPPKPTESSRVVITAAKIEFWDKIYFDTGKTTIRAQSHPLLTDIAAALRDHPELRSVRIEGHTDSRGDAKKNQKLSQGRADAVRKWLVAAGVAPERLLAEGFGESRPLDAAETSVAWDLNRRVEFVIVERRP